MLGKLVRGSIFHSSAVKMLTRPEQSPQGHTRIHMMFGQVWIMAFWNMLQPPVDHLPCLEKKLIPGQWLDGWLSAVYVVFPA